jgi:general secretion pathway protein L
MKILGVDIGSYSVKVAELEVSGSGTKSFALVGFHEFTLSTDPNKDRELEIIEGLRKLSSTFDAETTRWVIGIPQHRVSVHHKQFPFRERLKILKSLPFELEDEIPLDIDETLFEAKVVEYVGPTSAVLTIACPKDAVEEALAKAKDGGFDPEIVSVEGLALANLFENWDAAPPELPVAFRQSEETSINVTGAQSARIILHIGHTRTNLLVYREGGLVAVRSILWGGNEVAAALATAFHLPHHEALRVLQSKAFILLNRSGATRDQLLMSETVSNALDSLMRELRLTILEVRSTFNLDLKSIELLGGVARIQNLGPYVTQCLEIPANVGQALKSMTEIRMETSPRLESACPVAIGLAIEGLKRPRNPAINLRRGEFAKENEALKRAWETWKVPAQVAVSLFLIFTVYTFVRDSIATSLVDGIDLTIEEVAQSEAKLKGASATEIGLQNYVDKQMKLIASRDALAQIESYSSAMDVLLKLSEKLPVARPPRPAAGLDVTSLKIDQEVVTIEGRALGPSVIKEIESALTEISKEKSLKKIAVKNVPAVQRNGSATNAPTASTPFAYEFKVNRKP